MEIAHLIGKIIVGGFLLLMLFMFALIESDGFKKIPWATIMVIVLIIGVSLVSL